MLNNQRSRFSLPKNQTYLNCAYMSPLPKVVEKAGLQAVMRKRNPISISPSDFFTDAKKLRTEFGKLVNCFPNRVAIIPSASYGISTVAQNIPINKGEEIMVMGEQFPSNVYPWQRLASKTGAIVKTIEAPVDLQDRGREWNQKVLAAINSKTRVVAMGNVHWADGTLFNLQAIRNRTKEVGALLIIDGTQSVGALPIDVAVLQPDALVCAAYKWLLGPYAIGMAYFGDAFLDGIPLEENWITRLGSEEFSGLVKYEQHYQPGVTRFDMGERSNFILVPMAIEALRLVNLWKPKNIQQYAHRITHKPLATLKAAGWWIEDDSFRSQHLFGIRPPSGVDLKKIKEKLTKAKIGVSFRGNSIRVAPHVYNSEQDVWKLVNALIK